jgi:DNA-binding MarR family transcriptional regulator
MTAVAMTDDDREELARLVRETDEAEDRLAELRAKRNELMHGLFNSYRADITDLRHVTGMKRPTVSAIVRGPRTRPYRQRQDREG